MARKKSSWFDTLVGIVFVGAILVTAVQGLWPYLAGIAAAGFFVKIIVLPWWRKAQLENHRSTGYDAEFRPVLREVRRSSDDEVTFEVDWPETFIEIKRAIDHGAYDFARTWLQKFAYTTVDEDVPQSTRDQFKRLMTAFAERDPLYLQIVPDLVKEVAAQPGIVQTAIYPLLPQHNRETLRYVLYFAEAMGLIRRDKKGQSYRLFPVGMDREVRHLSSVGPIRRLGDCKSTTELSDAEAIARHPFFSRVTEQQLEHDLRAKGLDARTINGIIKFYLDQKEVFLRDIRTRLSSREVLPFLEYSAIKDDRTCKFCRQLDGKFIRIDANGDFIRRLPPFALGCRTIVVTVPDGLRLRRGGADDTDSVIKAAVPKDCPCGSWVEGHYWR